MVFTVRTCKRQPIAKSASVLPPAGRRTLSAERTVCFSRPPRRVLWRRSDLGVEGDNVTFDDKILHLGNDGRAGGDAHAAQVDAQLGPEHLGHRGRA